MHVQYICHDVQALLYRSMMYVFGGCNSSNENQYYSWPRRYEFGDNVWLDTIPYGDKPVPRMFHTAVLYEDDAIIFGGEGPTYVNHNDLYRQHLTCAAVVDVHDVTSLGMAHGNMFDVAFGSGDGVVRFYNLFVNTTNTEPSTVVSRVVSGVDVLLDNITVIGTSQMAYITMSSSAIPMIIRNIDISGMVIPTGTNGIHCAIDGMSVVLSISLTNSRTDL